MLKEYESFLLNEGFQPLSPPKDNLYQWINGDFRLPTVADSTGFNDYDLPKYGICGDPQNNLYALRQNKYTETVLSNSISSHQTQKSTLQERNKSKAGAVHLYSFKNDASDSVGDIDGVNVSGVSYVTSSDDFITDANNKSGDDVFSSGTFPPVDNTLSLSNGAIKFDGVQDELDIFNKSFTVNAWCNASSSTGYIWSVAGNTISRRFGVYLSSNLIRYTSGGTTNTIATHPLNEWFMVTLTWDHLTSTWAVYVNGVLDDSGVDSTSYAMNNAPFLVGARWNVNDAEGVLGFELDGKVRGLAIYNSVLPAGKIYGLYFNPNYYPVIVGIGSSSMDRAGATDPNDSFLSLHQSAGYTTGVQVLNIARGGRTFYAGCPTGYAPPSYVTGPRDSVETSRNVNFAVEEMGADFVWAGYASNFSGSDKEYTEGPQLWSEYESGMLAIKAYCEDNDVGFYASSPQPLGVSKDATRKETQRDVAKYLIDRYWWVIDAYNPVLGANNSLNPTYDADGTHMTTAGHFEVFSYQQRLISTWVGAGQLINLNPTADATLTGYGYDGTFQTQSALDALYNGTTIFPSPPAEKDRYLSFSPATTNATKADKYVKR